MIVDSVFNGEVAILGSAYYFIECAEPCFNSGESLFKMTGGGIQSRSNFSSFLPALRPNFLNSCLFNFPFLSFCLLWVLIFYLSTQMP